MKKIFYRIGISLLVIITTALLGGGIFVYQEFEKLESDDPLVWESAVNELTSRDSEREYPENAVLFVGSSSIRFWSTLEQDMAPLPVIQRGFGGAKLSDVLFFADRLIWPYKTDAIVLFAGTNDITGRENDKSPEEVLALFKELVSKMEKELPESTLYYLPITPTSSRWEIWAKADRANNLIADFSEKHDQVVYINSTPHFLNEDGSLREELLFIDGIHLNDDGYAVWTDLVREHLLAGR